MKKTLGTWIYTTALAGALLCATQPVVAETAGNNAVAMQAWRAIGQLEAEKGIPRGLLHSMSLVETGQGMDGSLLPWPYTINVNGTKAYSFTKSADALAKMDALRRLGFNRFKLTVADKAMKNLNNVRVENELAAVADGTTITLAALGHAKRFGSAEEGGKYVRNLIQNGYKNVDIGLMQINWYFHGENFKSVEEAFDPAKNASYAVSYLSKHREERDWWNSVGRYHSGTSKHAQRYIRSVYAMYRRVHRIQNS
ncbi:MAG: transglycosylase SLT domain-containing protein [Alphaproteobacteria bacterium]